MSDIVQKLHERYNTYREQSLSWRVERDRCRQFYFNHQWDKKVAKALLKSERNAMVINRIRPLLRMKASMLMQSSPIGQVVGIDDTDQDAVNALQDLAEYVLQISDWKLLLERACLHSIREGIFWFHVYWDDESDYGNGDLKVEGLPYEEVFAPKESNNFFLDDTEIIVSQLLTRDQYYQIYKSYSLDDSRFYNNLDSELLWQYGFDIPRFSGSKYDQISYSVNQSGYNPQTHSDVEFVRVFKSYSYKKVPVRVLRSNIAGIIREIPDDYELSPDEKQAVKDGLIDDIQIKIKKVLKIEVHGSKLISKQILPIGIIPVIPIINEDTGSSLPAGDTDFVDDTQALINKLASLTVLNMALGSNYRVLVDLSGTGYTVDDFKDKFVIPGSVLDLPRDQNGRFPVEIIRPEPLSPAHYNFMVTLFSHIEHSLSLFGLRLGNPSDAPETFGGLLQLGQWSDQAININFNRLSGAIERLYHVIFNWAPYVYTRTKAFVLTTNNQTRQQIINGTIERDGQILPLNNITYLRGRFRVNLAAGETQNQRTLNFLMQLVNIEPAVIDDIIDRLPIDNPQEIKNRISRLRRLVQENQQLQDALKKMGATINAISKENEALRRRLEVEKFSSKVKAE